MHFVLACLLGLLYMFMGRTSSDSPIAQWSERCTYEVTMNARVPSSILGGTRFFSFLSSLRCRVFEVLNTNPDQV